MKVQIEQVTKQQISQLISVGLDKKLTEDEITAFNRCLFSTTTTWLGIVNGKLCCVWGLIPPTLLSEQAYLWLYVTEHVKEYEFVFVRYSQRAVEDMLKTFPTIVGHATVGASRSLKWLKWLGAEFGLPEGKYVPFVIRKKQNG
jgi:hypothetical protein